MLTFYKFKLSVSRISFMLLFVVGFIYATKSYCDDDASRDSYLDMEEIMKLKEKGVILPFEEIIMIVVERYPGCKLLDAEFDNDDGDLGYEVTILLNSGEVREVQLDAKTGKVLSSEVED